MTSGSFTPSGLWSWAVDTYGRPGAKDALLALQNRHGVDVVLLLWRLWLRASGRTVDPGTEASAVALCASWKTSVVAPLRAARDALKTPTAGVETAGSRDLRRAVLEAELSAERLQLEALEWLSGPADSASGASGHLFDFLKQVPELSGLPHAELSPLAAALESR
jgi:uncharacterized protein (TIGR02444 family)